MHSFMIYFLLFLAYSIIGWVIETIYTAITKREIVNRGFLIGPYCPIYGVGALVMIVLLKSYHHDLFALFIVSVFVCTVIEYITSYLMEKIFKARWWDYSDLPFNINGRVCLLNSVEFGILSILLIKYVNIFISDFIYNMPDLIRAILFGFFLGIFTLDIIISVNIINKIKMTVINIKKDHTGEINEKVMRILIEKSYLFKRIFAAFPNIRSIIKKAPRFKLLRRNKKNYN
ncbi:MAG: putative ABC transporter permease [Ignavibacteriales bacterium]